MKRSADAAHLEWLEPESDEGNVEYKLRLKDPSTMRFQQLVTQMKFRLSEGNGECFYYLGEASLCSSALWSCMTLVSSASSCSGPAFPDAITLDHRRHAGAVCGRAGPVSRIELGSESTGLHALRRACLLCAEG